MSLPGLRQMKAAARPGMCPFCDQPLKPRHTKPHATCGAPECRTAWMRCWKRDQRQTLRELALLVAELEAAVEGTP